MWRVCAILILLLAVGCSTRSSDTSRSDPADSSQTSTGSSAGSRTTAAKTVPTSTRPRGAGLIIHASAYGPVLHDSSGQPIYLFDRESGSRPRCYDACAADWPPVLTTDDPRGKQPLRADLLGTASRADGTTQVTYAGHPLYFYAHEGKYEVLCHDVAEYGGTWLVVRADGTPAPS
jgi:predicted lipoprotein with Yx(FWY)xxD motif